MNVVIGYLRTIRQYLGTQKGWHDTVDYLRAIVIIGATMAVVYMLFAWF